MSPSGRRIGRHLVLWGGLVGLAAGPVASRVGERVRERVRRAGFGDDPVSPFRDAPCYSRPPDETAADECEARASS